MQRERLTSFSENISTVDFRCLKSKHSLIKSDPIGFRKRAEPQKGNDWVRSDNIARNKDPGLEP